jgi:hypothetical protein
MGTGEIAGKWIGNGRGCGGNVQRGKRVKDLMEGQRLFHPRRNEK